MHGAGLPAARSEPRILTYCLRSARPLSQLRMIAEAAGWQDAVVASNGRTTPEGVGCAGNGWRRRSNSSASRFRSSSTGSTRRIRPTTWRPTQAESEMRLPTSRWDIREAADLLRTLGEMGTPVDTYSSAAVAAISVCS